MSDAVKTEKLFVVVDPVEDHQLALERAVVTAKFRDPVADVHLYLSVDMDNHDTSADNPRLFKDHNYFNELVKPLQEAQIPFSIEASWCTDWYRAIVKAAERESASLILLPFERRILTQERLFTDSIWRLLRTVTCPILIMREGAQTVRKTVLAAVNFQSHKPEYEKLNQAVIDRGHWYAQKYDAQLHVVNAYDESLHYPDRTRMIRQSGLSSDHIHVKAGHPEEVIAETAKALNADVTVVGLRKRYDRWRGNTSEKVISELCCDVLVIN